MQSSNATVFPRRRPNTPTGLFLQSQGVTLAEVLVGLGIIAIASVSAIQGMTLMNRRAAETRVLNNAKAIVQEHIDAVLTLSYDPNAETPVIPNVLALGARTSNEAILLDASGGTEINGVLTENVTNEPNPDNLLIRRYNATITYTYRGRAFTYSLETLRAPDS